MENIISVVFDDGTTFNEQSITAEGFYFNDSICSAEKITYGLTEPKEIRFTLVNDNTSLIGKKFTFTLNTKLLGTFTVATDVISSDRRFRTITAYDDLHTVMETNYADWYNQLSFPITTNNFITLFCQRAGLDLKGTVGNSFSIEKTIDTDSLTGRDILNAFLVVQGCFGHLNANNEFVFITPDSYASAEIISYYKAPLVYEDYSTTAISGVVIKEDAYDIGSGEATADTYVIYDNFLCYGKSEADLRVIALQAFRLGNMASLVYVPYSVSCDLDMDIPVGSVVEVGGIKSFVLQREMSNFALMNISARGQKHINEGNTTMSTQMRQLRGKSNRLERTLDKTVSTIADLQSSVSTIEQTTDSISMRVEQLQSEVDGSIYVYNEEYAPLLTNYPAWDWTYNIPVNNTVQLRDDLQFEYKDEYWKKHARTLFFDELTGTTYRFEKQNEIWGWYPTKNTEFDYVISKVTELELRADGIDARTEEIRQELHDDYITTVNAESLISTSASQILSRVSADYVTKSAANATYETQVHAASQIKQTQDSITAEVTRATTAESTLSGTISSTKEELSSQIVQTSNSLTSTINARFSESKTYADTKAASAESNAKADTATKLKSYSTTAQMNTAISQTADSINATITTQISETKSYADSKAATAESNAKTDTATKLKSYSTTTQMNAAIKASSDSITASVSKQITETRTYADGKASTAESNAKSYASSQASTAESNAKADTTQKLKSYYTSTQMDAKLKVNADAISAEVTRATNAESTLRTTVTQTADSLTTEVTRAKNAEGALSTSISQTADAVKTKVSKGDISSEISQEAGKISISSDRFSLSSTNCTISEDGKITASDVDLSGKITATSGAIAGLTISQTAIKYGKASYGDDTKEGIYFGQDGFSVGTNAHGLFKVAKDGNAEIHGHIDIAVDANKTLYSRYGSTGATFAYGQSLKSEITYSSLKLSSSATTYTEVISSGLKVALSSSNYSTVEHDGVYIAQGTGKNSTLSYNGLDFSGDAKIKTASTSSKLTLDSYSVVIGAIGTTSKIGFFGSSGAIRQSVPKITSTSSATASTCATKINAILDALKNYGLITI